MKRECSIFRDLLPVYHDELTSEESSRFIKKHKEECRDCDEYYQQYVGMASENYLQEQYIQEARPYSTKRRQSAVRMIIAAVIFAFFGFMGVVVISTWSRGNYPEVLRFESKYKGKDRFQQEKSVLLEVAKQCEFSKDAKVRLVGLVPGVDFCLMEDGNEISFKPGLHTIYIYDEGKEYQLQYDGTYRVFVTEVEDQHQEVEEQNYCNFYDYIEMLDYYDKDVVSTLEFSYYHVEYMPYEQVRDTFELKEAKLYLYTEGEYQEVTQIPAGEYAYYAYVGSESDSRFTRTEGTYGYLFISISEHSK